MIKSNFLMIVIVLVLTFATWLLVQVVSEQVRDAKQMSGSDSYSGIEEELY